MEDYIKDPVQTAASNFYKLQKNDSQASQCQHQRQPNSFFFQSSNEQNRIQELQSRMMGLGSILQQLKDHYDKVNSDTTLDDWQNEKMINLDEIRENNETIVNQLKRDISFKFQKLDKQLQEMQKNRKQLKSKYQALLNDGLDEVKEIQKSTFKELTKLKNEKNEEFKKKNLLLRKQMQKLRKQEKKLKNQVFGNLEITRNKFHERVRNEQNKRGNLDNIIQCLLQKTCKKAENTIQRKLFENRCNSHVKI